MSAFLMSLSVEMLGMIMWKGSFLMLNKFPWRSRATSVYQEPAEETWLTLFAPLSGKTIPLEQVDDPVFAQRMVGDGLAILPDSDEVVSPVAGTITTLFPTGHAVGITTSDGLEVLIHVGLDTVELKGNGFKKLVQQGQKVDVGTPLIKLELDILQKTARSLQTPMIIMNGDKVNKLKTTEAERVVSGDWIMKVFLEK